MKPFLPLAEPWQVPALQPSFEITGIASSTKLISRFAVWPETFTGTASDLPANADRDVARAVCDGRDDAARRDGGHFVGALHG